MYVPINQYKCIWCIIFDVRFYICFQKNYDTIFTVVLDDKLVYTQSTVYRFWQMSNVSPFFSVEHEIYKFHIHCGEHLKFCMFTRKGFHFIWLHSLRKHIKTGSRMCWLLGSSSFFFILLNSINGWHKNRLVPYCLWSFVFVMLNNRRWGKQQIGQHATQSISTNIAWMWNCAVANRIKIVYCFSKYHIFYLNSWLWELPCVIIMAHLSPMNIKWPKYWKYFQLRC